MSHPAPAPWSVRHDTRQPPPSSSPPPSLPSQPSTRDMSIAPSTMPEDQNTPSTPRRYLDKPSNDSSIFVGSLPPNFDHIQLSYRLADHLSPFIDVRKVKVIRDHRGGVCAFVQCKDAPSAAKFIQGISTQPIPDFMGRTLRFEIARSSRTLLLSYRAPTCIVDDAGTVEQLELATAMRLFRAPGDRFVTIVYNDEALLVQSSTSPVKGIAATDDVLENGGVLFAPLHYDAQCLRKIAAAFGSIEYFRPYQSATEVHSSYPPPHNMPKVSSMDQFCYEVKWEQREDSMAALMALRTVPHLSVSWAHLVSQRSETDSHLSSPCTVSTLRNHLSAMTPSGWVSPIRIDRRLTRAPLQPPIFLSQGLKDSPGGETKRTMAHRSPNTLLSTKVDHEPQHGSIGQYSEVETRGTVPVEAPVGQNLSTVSTSPHSGRSPITPRSVVSVLANGSPVRVTPQSTIANRRARIQWFEDDFPPLAEPAGNSNEAAVHSPTHVNDECQAIQNLSTLSISTGAPTSTSLRLTSSHSNMKSVVRPAIPVPSDAALSSLSMTRDETAESEAALLTPDTGIELTTPIDRFSSRYSPLIRGEDAVDEDIRHGKFISQPMYAQKSLDHMTIFIGGMEMFGPNAWDEGRIRNVFERYGSIERVKFIKPYNKKSAFAFVRYRNIESSAKAVMVEHNKVYDGRHLRVQIREHNILKPSFLFPTDSQSAIRSASGRGSRPYDFSKPRQRWPRRFNEGNGQARRQHRDYFSDSTSPPASFSSTYPTTTTQTPEPVLAPTSSPASIPVEQSAQFSPSSVAHANSSSGPLVAHHPNSMQTASQVPGYYAPQPWMMQSLAYPMPFTPYSGYYGMPPSASYPVQEGGPPLPGAQHALYPYPYPTFNPYNEQPSMPRPTDSDPRGRQVYPPLVPTSFVQGEHGLMPVYPPEALDRYISRASTGGQSDVVPTTEQSLIPSGPAGARPNAWTGIPYAYPPMGQIHAAAQAPQTPGRAGGWFASPMAYGAPPFFAPPQGLPGIPPATSLSINSFFAGPAAVASPHQAGSWAGYGREVREADQIPPSHREYYADVHVPVIGTGPPPVPPPRPVRQQGLVHRKGAASMEQASSQDPAAALSNAATAVKESRSSPVISSRTFASTAQGTAQG